MFGDLVKLKETPERNPAEHDELGSRIVSIDVRGGIGLRVPKPLRIGEDDIERFVGLEHPAEDVVARAIEDADDAGEIVARESFADPVNQRNAATNGRFESEQRMIVGGKTQQLRTMMREQHLVRGDDRCTLPQRARDDGVGRLDSAHHFDDDVR